MADYTHSLEHKVAFITGAARRIGAQVARTLHEAGMTVAIHYRRSQQAAEELQAELNALRPDSVHLFQADLLDTRRLPDLVDRVVERCGRLDCLVNNASSFYPTPVGTMQEEHWEDLLGSNLRAPLFLSQAAAGELAARHGCIVNMADIHADRPLKQHTLYCIAKAGVVMMTKSLARELGPNVRVNAIAPGAILWPENDIDEVTRKRIVSRTALKRSGDPLDIARTILFLVRDAGYTTGQVLTVDGGRGLTG